MVRAVVRQERPGTPSRQLKAPRVGLSRSVVKVVGADGVMRIRLSCAVSSRGRVSLATRERGTVEGEMFHRVTHWLDGRVDTEIWLGQVVDREVEYMGAAQVVAGQTKSIADFGRLETACATLVGMVDALPPDAPEEQVESLLASYQGVLAWMNEARTKMTAAEGQVDVVQAKLMARLMS